MANLLAIPSLHCTTPRSQSSGGGLTQAARAGEPCEAREEGDQKSSHSGDPNEGIEATHLKDARLNFLVGDVDEQLRAFLAKTAASADRQIPRILRPFIASCGAEPMGEQFVEVTSAVEPAQEMNLVESACAICLEISPPEASSEAWFTCLPQPKEFDDGQAGWTGCCGTRVCSECMAQYLRLKIMEGDTVLRCPGQCRRDLSDAEVHRHAPSFWQRVGKLRQLRNNPNLRDCPSCGCLTEGSRQSPDMTCSSCMTSFCFNHGLAHTGVTCRQHNRMARFAPASGSVSGHDIRTRLQVRLTTQACPRCHARVQRSGGCAHMTCRCGAHFCWHCGKATSDGGRHYQLWGACRSSAMRGKRLGVVLGGTVGIPVALATSPIWGPLMCCYLTNYDSD